jgi:hypothetical protein
MPTGVYFRTSDYFNAVSTRRSSSEAIMGGAGGPDITGRVAEHLGFKLSASFNHPPPGTKALGLTDSSTSSDIQIQQT